MNGTELRERLRRGERCAPDPAGVVRAVTAARRRRARRRHILQVAGVVVAVAVLAGGVTLAVRGFGPDAAAPTIGPSQTAGPSVTAAELARYRWSSLPTAPIPGRTGAATVWTGSEMLVWGGQNAKGDKDFADGAGYDPATRRWRTLAAAPLSARAPTTWVWTGSELFVWGGDKGQLDGALYDPDSDRWSKIPALPSSVPASTDRVTAVIGPPTDATASRTAPVTTTMIAPDGPVQATAVWTGHDVALLVWRSGGPSVQAWTYRPGGDGWSSGGAIAPRSNAQIGQVAAAAVGGTVYAWVGWSYIVSQDLTTTASRDIISGYALSGSSWHGVDQRPKMDAVGPLVVAGADVVMGPSQPYEGFHSGPFVIVPGRLIDPVTGRSSELPALTGGAAMDQYQVAWTGGALLGYGSDTDTENPDGTEHLPGAAAAWDPVSDRWTTLAGSPMAFDSSVPGVWTGTELLVWGLMGPATQTDTGEPDHQTVGLQFAPLQASATRSVTTSG